MHFKRLIPVASSVYRPLAVRRYVMMTMGGFWPVIQKLPDGRLGVVTRDADFHIGERGRLAFVTSSDAGASCSRARSLSGAGPATPSAPHLGLDVMNAGRHDPGIAGREGDLDIERAATQPHISRAEAHCDVSFNLLHDTRLVVSTE